MLQPSVQSRSILSLFERRNYQNRCSNFDKKEPEPKYILDNNIVSRLHSLAVNGDRQQTSELPNLSQLHSTISALQPYLQEYRSAKPRMQPIPLKNQRLQVLNEVRMTQLEGRAAFKGKPISSIQKRSRHIILSALVPHKHSTSHQRTVDFNYE